MRGTTWAAGTIVLLAALGLTGCVPEAAAPEPTETAVDTPEPSGTPTPTPEPEPVLDLQGTAKDNLRFFNTVNKALVAQGGSLDGRSFIDNLVDAGFSKSTMEVTPDRTTVNVEADQVQFSVRLNGSCLIGQYGGGKYNGVAAEILATGTCLIGSTRPIDW
jgi:hypothetical protein